MLFTTFIKYIATTDVIEPTEPAATNTNLLTNQTANPNSQTVEEKQNPFEIDSKLLPPPAYMFNENKWESAKNLVVFGITSIVVFIPFHWLKNIKYNIVAVCGLIMALNHFNVYNHIINGIHFMTPDTWGSMFINTLVFLIISFLNMFYKSIRIITSSLGGGYIAGYVTCLFLNMTEKLTVACFMGGYVLFYAAMYFLLKKARKFMLFSSLAGWNLYSCANILFNCKFILQMYTQETKTWTQGSLILAAFLGTSLLIYSIMRLIFYKKNTKKKEDKK